MNGACSSKKFCPTPWGLGESSKGQISLNYNNKVNFKDFIPNFVCALTNKIYKIYQMGFCSYAWVMPQGWDLRAPGVPRGSKIHFFSSMVM